MGSLDAMKKKGTERYLVNDDTSIKVAQGVSGTVLGKGSISKYIPYLVQSIKHGFQDIGVNNINTMHTELYNGNIEFELRSISAMKEAEIHDLLSYEK